MKVHWKIFLVALLIIAFTYTSMAATYNRNETLVVCGAQWSAPSNWNPLTYWAEAPGTGGLVYEFLFAYDPLTDTFKPWLAESGKWLSDNEYQITLRKGIEWTDGEEFNAEDVAFTFELAKDNQLHYSNTWTWLNDVKIVDNYTLNFTFKEPHYAEWDGILYGLRIIPEHIWSKLSADELITTANKNPVGTGPYMAETAAQDRMVWVRNENWWGNEVFGKPVPKYIVDLVNTSNNVILGSLMKREIDLSNNFIPGVEKIKDAFGLKTWYKDAPYMLSWNTAMLYMNNRKAPMDDPAFRKAMAFAIKKDDIVNKVYAGMVKPANPTGLFGEAWMKFYDEEVVENFGFYYDPLRAKAILEDAGYVDVDGDGFREQPNGDPIKLSVIVPNGWTDWMEAIKVIANSAQAVGINVVPEFPDWSIWQTRHQSGNYDMVIQNQTTTLSASPFTYWNGVANSEIHGDTITDGNFSAYDNPELFDLISEFNTHREDDPEAQEIASEIQRILLVDMPSIPLWHNGLWAQWTEGQWTNWPNEENPYGVPVTWGSAWQFGMIEILTELEPVQ